MNKIKTKPLGCKACMGFSCRPPTSGFVPSDVRLPLKKIKLAAMAEAAGESEVIQGIPLCGATGTQLQTRILNPLGLSREEIIVDNLIRCKPHGNNFPEGKLRRNMIETCRQWDSVIDLYDPNVIIMAFHPTFALIYTNQAYSTWNAFSKALRLHREGYRSLVLMGQEAKETFLPQLPGSITAWDGKHFFIKWRKGGLDFDTYAQAIRLRVEPKKLSLKGMMRD